MPGAVDWDPDIIRAPTDYAKRRGDIWLAGSKAVELGEADHEGQIISPSSQAVKFYKYRQTINQRKNIMREYEGEGLGSGADAEEEAKRSRTAIVSAWPGTDRWPLSAPGAAGVQARPEGGGQLLPL
jgi:hypothetical protein